MSKPPLRTPPVENNVTDEMLFEAIISMAKELAELIRNLAVLMHLNGRMPDDVFHRMVKSANTIQKDALKLEQKHGRK